MANIMVDVYVKLVLAGRKSIEEVPERLRGEVVEMLKNGGDNGNKVQVDDDN